MPGTTFLPIAGPIGTAAGIAAGAAVMLLIGANYSYLINRYPDAGGTFSYTRNVFGYDHGLLASWFMCLVYLAIVWANATAIPLICRGLFGDLFKFGFSYSVAGFDVYAGEIMISLIALFVSAFLCIRGARVASVAQIIGAIVLIGGIIIAFCIVFTHPDAPAVTDMKPLWPEERPFALSMLFIVFLAPWAFAGFESISHSAEEFRFQPNRSFMIMIAALITAAAAYILLALISSSSVPAGLSGWQDYFSKLSAFKGIASIPVFHAVRAAAGTPGMVLLGFAAAAGILTGLIGNMTAASRMLFSMSRDDLIPASLGRLNGSAAPANALLLLLIISLPIPFLGRASISWIIDVNTIGVTIAYAYTSAAAFKAARDEKRFSVMATGAVGIAVSLFFLVYFLLPGVSTISALATESYMILVAWSLLGFIVFYLLFRRDPQKRLGQSTSIWIVLLLLMFFTSMVWVSGTTSEITASSVSDLEKYYAADLASKGITSTAGNPAGFIGNIGSHFSEVTRLIIRNTMIQFIMILVSLLIVFNTYRNVQKQRQTAVEDKLMAEQSSQSKSMFLSNMSHDIRTPMNAIIGYVTLAKREKDLSPKTMDYLNKIGVSSDHLLALINDVLEMSRIESGRMELMPVPTDIRRMMDETRDLFSTQMETKNINYSVSCENVSDPRVLCDRNRMNRVLQNLISNAYKFTPEGGSVDVKLTQTGREDDTASFRLSVKDTGIGMSPEFAAKVFEAYAREKTAAVENIQGTGLGTAITKNIVELMGGDIQVFSEQGKGSEFVINVSLKVDPAAASVPEHSDANKNACPIFAGKRLLLVEDDAVNRDVTSTLLRGAGFDVDTAVNGEDAVEKIAASAPGKYAAVLMDIQMPVKDGYSAARLIRSLRNKELANIPIVAVTAKAFSEDIAEALGAGMNAHIAKPINMDSVLATLSDLLGESGSGDNR